MTPSLRPTPSVLAALCLAVLIAAGLSSGPLRAQNLFEPVIFVNDSAVTRYEIQQRARMLTLFRAPGDPAKLAREQLIEERLKLEAAKGMGVTIAEDAVLEGMDEFATRAGMDRAQMITALEQSGVSEQSFKEFVRAGITWREVTRARFAGRVSVSEEELERATLALSGGSAVRVLLSEIILPVTTVEDAEAKQELAARIRTASSESAFAALAREHSAAPTAGRGGRLDWQSLSDLPPALRQVALGLAPGEVSEPLPIEGGLALIYLRDIQEGEVQAPQYSAIEYAAYYIAGGRSEQALARAAEVRAEVDTCDDLFGVAQDQPPEVLERGSKAPEDIPADIAAELARLDPGEVSTRLTRANGQTLVFLMLCGRTPRLDDAQPSIEDLTGFIRNQRIQSLADGYLQQLKAEARIVER
ncbi:peptidyl-prolyl cis-trans isomerase SurA [Roseovarius sp. MBR-78]|uniref:peptidylprolyl isomerase n=1 Tax=Roseovarius sp. MBR-78 TaxID=3156460 RepID=UPI003395B2F7